MGIEYGMKFEHDPSYDPERLEQRGEKSRESEADLRREHEVFRDHERLDTTDRDDELARLRDSLTEDSDGIIHLSIAEYDYDFAMNPFVGMGAHVRRTYAISRYLDVVFLHRYMFQDIIVCGLQSRAFVDERGRAAFVRHIRDTGGLPVDTHHDRLPYDIVGQAFMPFVQSDSMAAWMTLYHKQSPRLEARPHYPLDIWMIFDAHAYLQVDDETDDFRKAYQLRDGYDRRASLIGVAQIN